MGVQRIVQGLLRRAGYELVRAVSPAGPLRAVPDLSEDERRICRAVAPFTLTSSERVLALIHATQYLIPNGIDGDVVECGVWRGGSAMAVAHALRHAGDERRRLCLFDTFEGMPAPSARDVRLDGTPASQLPPDAHGGRGAFRASMAEVRANLGTTGYPAAHVTLVQGLVEETVPAACPETIALLHLDTDWYSSTRHALTHLYPRLSRGGVLIIDDYGHWRGAREAVDEFFADAGPAPFLHRIDYTGRLVIKP